MEPLGLTCHRFGCKSRKWVNRVVRSPSSSASCHAKNLFWGDGVEGGRVRGRRRDPPTGVAYARRIQDTMNQPSGKITLLGVNEHAAGKGRTSITGHQGGFHAVLNGGDAIRMQAQSKRCRRKQFPVGGSSQQARGSVALMQMDPNQAGGEKPKALAR